MAFGIEGTYQASLAAKQRDPRVDTRFYNLELKPGVTYAINPRHRVGANFIYASIKEDSRMSNSDSYTDQDYYELYGLGVAVDVYHVWWDPDLASQILRAGKRILAFHVSDWLVPTTDLVNDRGMPGDGVINIPSIRRLVENAGFNGAIELEIFSPYWWQKDINSTLDISVDRIAHYC